MQFTKMDMRLVSVNRIKSKSGDNDLFFVTMADKKTYENVELMAVKTFDPNIFVAGSDYDMVVDIHGKFVTIELYPVGTFSAVDLGKK